MIEYKGYIGVVDFDPEIDLSHGTIINTQNVITFYGASVIQLRAEMQKSLEIYFEVCEEQGKVQTFLRNADDSNKMEIVVYLREALEKAISVG